MLALLTLLALLPLLVLRVLLRAIAHPLTERLEAAVDVAHPILRAVERIFLLTLAECRLRIGHALPQRVEVGRELLLDLADGPHVVGLPAHRGLHRVLGVADLLANPLVGDGARRLVELARRRAVAAARLVRDLLELLLQVGDLACPSPSCARRGPWSAPDVTHPADPRGRPTSDCTCFCSAASSSARRSASWTSRSPRPVWFCWSLRCASWILSSALRASASPFWPAGGRLAHLVGRFLELPRRVGEVLFLLLARELLQPPRQFLGLLRDLPLQVGRTGAAAAALHRAALTLDLLLLPARELLQLFGGVVDLLIGALHARRAAASRTGSPACRARARTGRRGPARAGSAAAAASAAAATALRLHLQLVLLLGVLQQLQRLLLRRERFLGLQRLELTLGELHLGRRLRQRVGDRLERRIDDVQTAVHLLGELFDLLAELGLLQRQEDVVLAVLVVAHLGAVAYHVERRGDDLPLLLRELADLLSCAAAAPAAARHRRRRLEVGAERTDLHEVDVARRRLAAGDAVVVGRLRVIRHEVARLQARALRDTACGLP